LVTTPAEELLTAIPSAATSLGCLEQIQAYCNDSLRQSLQHSVRSNLDPTADYSDSDLTSALFRVSLLSLIRESGGLDTLVMPDTFSRRQQQLFSITRTLLRKAGRKAGRDLPACGRVLLLDEATSNMDQENEQLVQRVIADEFRGFTILVVAHRPDTVFEEARLIEFDSTTALRARPSAFRDLYDEYHSQAR
jgi:ATP-binding cassette subfamily C (CFTR/MRP) protein 1